jgi:hypothetical protein
MLVFAVGIAAGQQGSGTTLISIVVINACLQVMNISRARSKEVGDLILEATRKVGPSYFGGKNVYQSCPEACLYPLGANTPQYAIAPKCHSKAIKC